MKKKNKTIRFLKGERVFITLIILLSVIAPILTVSSKSILLLNAYSFLLPFGYSNEKIL